MTPADRFPGGAGEPGEGDSLSRLFAGPTDEDRARMRADLIARAFQVQVGGWAPYRRVWSTGEVIGVAALMGDLGELTAIGENLQSAWERWAFDLWGLNDGQADVDNDCERTREWFLDAARRIVGSEASSVGSMHVGESSAPAGVRPRRAMDSHREGGDR